NFAAIVPRLAARGCIGRSTLRGGELAAAPFRPPRRARGARRSSREQIGGSRLILSHPGLAWTNRLASAAMTRDELKRRVVAAIDRRAAEIVALGERIRRHPERGFKEAKTAGAVQETLGPLGMTPRTGRALTGLRAAARGRRRGGRRRGVAAWGSGGAGGDGCWPGTRTTWASP